jgi:hypothetical protein
MFTKVSKMLSISFNAWQPCDAKNCRYTEHFQACCRIRLNQTPQLAPRVRCFRGNYAILLVPQVEAGRCAMGQSRRQQNQFVSSYPSIWVLRVQSCFASRVKWAGAPSCINQIVCRVANGTSPSSWGNSSVKKVNWRPLRVEAVKRKVL